MARSEGADKVNEERATRGGMGQRYLASGELVSMRLWDGEEPGEPEAARPYETVGYVVGGRAELHLDGEFMPLGAGDSWTVPKGSSHTYEILETFTAVEATSPRRMFRGATNRRRTRPESRFERQGRDGGRVAGAGGRAARVRGARLPVRVLGPTSAVSGVGLAERPGDVYRGTNLALSGRVR